MAAATARGVLALQKVVTAFACTLLLRQTGRAATAAGCCRRGLTFAEVALLVCA